MENIVSDKIHGVIYGQAIGDALGLGTEFMTQSMVKEHYPSGLKSYEQIVHDGHRSRWRQGDWTDDTDQMLCILDSLLEKQCISVFDISARIYRWLAFGHSIMPNLMNREL